MSAAVKVRVERDAYACGRAMSSVGRSRGRAVVRTHGNPRSIDRAIDRDREGEWVVPDDDDRRRTTTTNDDERRWMTDETRA